jgi:peptidoglycan/LPS O-acetylase OafA/YrhL
MANVNSGSNPSYPAQLDAKSGLIGVFPKVGPSRDPQPSFALLSSRSAAELYLEPGKPRPGADIPGLDGLRAVSILLVMVSHSGLQQFVPGVFGVTIFFFISGFLITSLFIAEHDTANAISIKRFYLRRVLRLYPPLLIYIIAMSVISTAGGLSIDFTGLFGALFYFANYLYALSPEHVSVYGVHLWSLSVEEHFYLFFPLLFAVGIGRSTIALCLLIALGLGIRIAEAHFGATETYTSVATECRFDTILTGCATAVALSRPDDRFMRVVVHPITVVAALFAILSTFVIRDTLFRQTFRFTIQNIALVPLVLSAVVTPRYLAVKKVLNCRPLKWIGVLSYSLYLWHFAMFDLTKATLGDLPELVRYGAGWLLAFCLAVAIHFLVERPMFKLRRLAGSKAHEQLTAGPDLQKSALKMTPMTAAPSKRCPN